MPKNKRQAVSCFCCDTPLIEGNFSEGIILCNTCRALTDVCPHCNTKYLIDNKCQKCLFIKQNINCKKCNKNTSNGKLQNGYFLCDDCIFNPKLSDCPLCKHHQFRTYDFMSAKRNKNPKVVRVDTIFIKYCDLCGHYDQDIQEGTPIDL